MRYIATLVFGTVAPPLREKYKSLDILVTGEYTDSPAKFPAVSIIEADNADYIPMRTAHGEQASKLMYEVTVYSNRVGGATLEAYEIMGDIDDYMTGRKEYNGNRLGFHRTMCSPVYNLQDASIFSLKARYEGINKPEYDGEDVNNRIYIG